MARKATDTVQLKLRFPEALRRQLERAAKVSDNSMNAEIINRLEGSFRAQSNSLLAVIVRATMGGEPKYIAPSHGRELGFAPSVKAQMKSRLAAFIDSLPDAEETSLSEEEIEDLWEMVQRHKLGNMSAKDKT